MRTPKLPAEPLRDLLGLVRLVWWARWSDGATEQELSTILLAGDSVARLSRGARFSTNAEVWHHARLAMSEVVRLSETIPWAERLLRAGAARVMAVKGIPDAPKEAFAAPGLAREAEP